MTRYKLEDINDNWREQMLNNGPLEDELELLDWLEDREIAPDNLPVRLEEWSEGDVVVGNAPAQSEWIAIGWGGKYADVLADNTYVMPMGGYNPAIHKNGERAGEIISWLYQNCQGQFVIQVEHEDEDGNCAFMVLLLDTNDLMRFKLTWKGMI